ncbi:MAG: hypothetical protein MAG715_01027 [Methanonatronarchaeales archaeon]|nr:hypothetical protein [Methanonatronarchaeales archaeon]
MGSRPFWTAQTEEQGAREPLGANRASDRLVADLLHGITTTSQRARYYSFYTWCAHELDKEDDIEDWNDLRDGIYELERAYLLSCIAHRAENGSEDHRAMEGEIKGSRTWEEGEDTVDLDFRFLSSLGGGYTQDYRGPTHTIGLLRITEGDKYDKPTDRGKEIASLFDKVATKAGLKAISKKSTATKRGLLEAGKSVCLCRLGDEDAPEREALREIFLRDRSSSSDKRHIFRKQSLLYILFLAERVGQLGTPLDTSTFRSASYLRAIPTGDTYQSIAIPEELNEIVERWSIFTANDFFTYCLECLLSSFLSEIEGGGTNNPDDFVSDITRDSLSLIESITEDIDSPETTNLSYLVESTSQSITETSWGEPYREPSREFDRRVGLDHHLNEVKLVEELEAAMANNRNQEKIGSVWIVLLLTLYMRNFRLKETRSSSWAWIQNHANNDLSIVRFVDYLHQEVLNQRLTVEEFARDFFNEYVIREARNIALSKPNIPTYFSRGEDGYVMKRDHDAGHRTTRLNSSKSTLRDLGLATLGDTSISPTQDGLKILDKFVNGG